MAKNMGAEVVQQRKARLFSFNTLGIKRIAEQAGINLRGDGIEVETDGEIAVHMRVSVHEEGVGGNEQKDERGLANAGSGACGIHNGRFLNP